MGERLFPLALDAHLSAQINRAHLMRSIDTCFAPIPKNAGILLMESRDLMRWSTDIRNRVNKKATYGSRWLSLTGQWLVVLSS
jgi:hypothetical protein